MSDINLVDVTVHVDEDLDEQSRQNVEQALRDLNGVVSVHNDGHAHHLFVVEYNPDQLKAQHVLACVQGQGVHAELLGL